MEVDNSPGTKETHSKTDFLLLAHTSRTGRLFVLIVSTIYTEFSPVVVGLLLLQSTHIIEERNQPTDADCDLIGSSPRFSVHLFSVCRLKFSVSSYRLFGSLIFYVDH